MKLSLSILAALFSSPALASPALWCGSDTSGLSVAFATPARYATLQTASENGLRPLAELTCRDVNPAGRADHAYLLCTATDANYSVALGNEEGLAAAIYDGELLLAELPCGRN